MSETLAEFIAHARRHDKLGLIPPAIHTPKPKVDEMTDGQTEVQEHALTAAPPPPLQPVPIEPNLLLCIRPAACNLWRWVLFQGDWIIAEGTPRATEQSAVDSARWMLAHAFAGEIKHTEFHHNPSENTVMSETELTLARKVGAVRDLLKKAAPQIARALPNHLTPERMLRIVETCVQRTPKLLDADPRSLIGAVVEASQLGLEPDGTLGHAYLVPFFNNKTKRLEVQLIPGFKGLMDLAYRSGQVVTIHPAVVCENDRYTYTEGLDATLQHIPSPGGRGEVIAAYAVAKLTNGGTAHVWLWRDEIDKVRAGSQAGKTGPWKTHFPEMAKKTAVRRLCKELPVSVVQRAAVLQEQVDAGGAQTFMAQLDFGGSEVVDVASTDPAVIDAESADAPADVGSVTNNAASDDVPPVDDLAFCAGAEKRFSAATLIKDCDNIRDIYLSPGLPDSIKDSLARLYETRTAEIRATRGGRSNQKPEASPSDEVDPLLAASEERRDYLLRCVAQIDRAPEVDKLNEAAGVAKSQGDLFPEHREEVSAACDGRRAELVGKKQTGTG